MSAAEKLRALDEAMTVSDWTVRESHPKHVVMPTRAFGEMFTTLMHDEPNARAVVALRNALPQIVAVVEAAERERSPHHADYWAREKDCPLCAALAALDEKLASDR